MTETLAEPKRRILVIDDNASIHEDFRKILSPAAPSQSLAAAKAALFGAEPSRTAPSVVGRFEVEAASQGQEGVLKAAAAVEQGDPYQVAFVDMRMPPGWDGLTTIRHLWQTDPDVEVVVCTAYSDSSLETLGGQLGRSSKLLVLKKPFDTAEITQLASTLCSKWHAERTAAMRVEELESMVRTRTAEIEHASMHDRLTGLPNRTMLMMRLEHCIELRRRNAEHNFAVLFLDRFKLINDSLGHAVGDLLLVEIAARLRRSLRGSDSVSRSVTPSRLGGDEFIVLLEDLRETRDAPRVAQRLLDVLAEPYCLDGHKLFSTASIGIATSDCDYDRSGDMLRDADTAMYRAKAEGRARFVMFDQDMHREAQGRLALENGLRAAIGTDALQLHYQPIVRLADGHLTGFEGLVRWSHPQRGPVPASELISVAEETGLIGPLGMSVFGMACRQMKAWQDRYAGATGLRMSVNLSRKQLVDSDLVAKMVATTQEVGIDPTAMTLEVTESALLHDQRVVIATLAELRDAGIAVQLDDFGTGYSSLSCLYQLPLAGIKLDRMFIQEACARPEQARMLAAIVDLSRAFRLRITAEGIETPEQLAVVRALEIDFGQGYLFGKPAAVESAEQHLRNPGPVAAPESSAVASRTPESRTPEPCTPDPTPARG